MRVFDGRQAQKQEIHGGLEMKCGKWYDMVHPVQKRLCILCKNYIDFLIYYYIIYNIADTKNRWPEDRPRLLLSGRASSQGAALFLSTVKTVKSVI